MHGRNGRGALLLLPLALAALAACGADSRAADAPFAAVLDDAGDSVAVRAAPARIVSLIPSVTEMVVALGAADRLIARTDYDAHPALDTLPTVGGGLDPNLEWLIARAPELVVGWVDGRARGVMERLRELGIPVYSARIETLEDAEATLLRLGILLGLEEEARALARHTAAELERVRRRVAGREPPRVFYLQAIAPAMTVGSGTYLNELIRIAGGENIFGEASSSWPQVSVEEVLRRDPDILLLPSGDGYQGASVERLAGLPGWGELRAVREGRVHAVDADLFHRPGPHVPEVARRLAAIFHPDSAGE